MVDASKSGLVAEADGLATRGDLAGAIALLREVTAQGAAAVEPWLKLATLNRLAGDPEAALRAISGALAIDPLNFTALLSRARLLDDAGDADAAAHAYARALARRPAGDLPTPLQSAIARAERLVANHRNRQQDAWAEAVAASGVDDPRRLSRLRRFATNATRETRPFHSEPVQFHYPGLVEREFHDRQDFPWLATLEAAYPVIRAEYLALVADGSGAEPYVQYPRDAPVAQWRALNHSPDWSAFHLLRNGDVVAENAARCPQTMAALTAIDQPHIRGKSPNAMFSVLRPRTAIPPHVGVANTRLVCHLPLVVPDRCWFRVGAETREWEEGKAFVFDDTIEHEASNGSDFARAVLIVDAWHPGLDPVERGAVTRIMEWEGGRYADAL